MINLNLVPTIIDENEIIVFVPVHFDQKRDYDSSAEMDIMELDPIDNTQDITTQKNILSKKLDLQYLAQLITKKSKNQMIQIGLSAKEAEDIINQHKHYYPVLIVQLNIAPTLIVNDRFCEKDLRPSLLNAKNKKSFCCLLQNSTITANNIVSIYAMTFYKNSTIFDWDYVDRFWPQDFVYQNSSFSVANLSSHNSHIISNTSSSFYPSRQTHDCSEPEELIAKLNLK